MQRLLLHALTSAAPFACAACHAPVEIVQVPLEPVGWRVGLTRDLGPGTGTITEWIPESQTLDDWREKVSMQLLEELVGQQSDEVVAALLAEQRALYAHVDCAVVEQDEWSVLYESVVSDSPPHTEQHELARMIEGDMGMHRIAYVRKGPRLDAEERAAWIDLLRAAIVVFEGRPLRPVGGSD